MPDKPARHAIAMTFTVRSHFSHDEITDYAERLVRPMRSDFGESNVVLTVGDPTELLPEDEEEGGGEEDVPPADDVEEREAPKGPTEKPETAGPNILG